MGQKSEKRTFQAEGRASFRALGQDHVGTDARVSRDNRMEGRAAVSDMGKVSGGPEEVGQGRELRYLLFESIIWVRVYVCACLYSLAKIIGLLMSGRICSEKEFELEVGSEVSWSGSGKAQSQLSLDLQCPFFRTV